MKNSPMFMDDQETLNRRARLRELIRECFPERGQVGLLDHIEKRTNKRPNQGELSAIQKDNGGKPFGDKKAKALTEQIGLHRRWFDMPKGANIYPVNWKDDFDQPNKSPKTSNQPKALYANFDKATREVIEIMAAVDHDYQQQILGNAKMLMAEFKTKKHPKPRAG